MLLKCCIICYRKLDEDVSEGGCNKSRGREDNSSLRTNCEGTVSIVYRFFQFLERYLDGTEVRNAKERHKKRKHSKGVFKAMLNGGMLGSCEDCLKLLNEFCETYHRMKEMELMLNWKLWSIKNIMGSARKVGARITIFREGLRNLVAGEDIGNADEIANAIFVFKKEIGMKCTRKLLKFPKVKVHRCSPNAQTDPTDGQCHIRGAKEQQIVLNKAEKRKTGKTRDSELTFFPLNVPTEKNESNFDNTMNDVDFQTNSQLEASARTISSTGYIEIIPTPNSAENIEVTSFVKIEAQAKEPTNPMDESSLVHCTNVNDKDPLSTLVPLVIPNASKKQLIAVISNHGQSQENADTSILQITKSQKCMTRARHPSDDDVSKANLQSPSLIEQLDEAETEERYLTVTPDDRRRTKAAALLSGNQQENCSKSNFIKQRSSRINKTGEGTTPDSQNKNNRPTDISPTKLGNGAEFSTQLSSCDIYLPCNSIISAIALESNLESDNHNTKRVLDMVGDAADAVVVGKVNATSSGVSLWSPLSLRNIILTSGTDSGATSNNSAKEIEKNTEQNQIPHDDLDEVNHDLVNKAVQLSQICDRAAKKETEETCNEGIIPDSEMSSIANVRSLRAIHRCSKCAKSFSTKRKLIEHEEVHDIDDDFGRDSEYSSLCDSLSESENEEVMEGRCTRKGTANSNEKCGKDSYPCKIEPCRPVSPTFEDFKLMSKINSGSQFHIAKKQIHYGTLLEIPEEESENNSNSSDSSSFCDSLRDTEDEDDIPKKKAKGRPGRKRKDSVKQVQEVEQSTEVFEEGQFPCEIEECPEILRTNAELNAHGKLHGSFSCQVCKATFGYAPKLAIHEVTEHPIISGDAVQLPKHRYYCPRTRCPFVLDGKEAYIRHHLWAHQKLRAYQIENVPAFPCTVCRLIIQPSDSSSRSLLEDHRQRHHHSKLKLPDDEQKAFKCKTNYCTAHFRSDAYLKIHEQKVHGIGGNLRDFASESQTGGTKSLFKSVIGKPNMSSLKHAQGTGKLFGCHSCEMFSSYSPDIAMHEVTEHATISSEIKALSPSIYQCLRPNCEFTVEGKVAIIRHYLTRHCKMKHLKLDKHPRKICSICNAAIKTNTFLHYESHHNMKTPGAEIYSCKEKDCTAYFVTPRQVNLHQIKEHGITEEYYKCDICNKGFRDGGQVSDHRKRVHKEIIKLPFRCLESECEKSFETERDLQRHIFWSHKGYYSNIYNCEICNKTVRGKRNLASHVKAQHSERKPKPGRFVCEQCGKKISTKVKLEQHFLSHTGPSSWQFSCSVCQKKCLTKQKLEEHVRTHTKEKPFVCDICGEKYAHRHNLRIHVNNKHSDIAKDLPRHFDRTNLTSQKGVKRKKPAEPEAERQPEPD